MERKYQEVLEEMKKKNWELSEDLKRSLIFRLKDIGGEYQWFKEYEKKNGRIYTYMSKKPTENT